MEEIFRENIVTSYRSTGANISLCSHEEALCSLLFSHTETSLKKFIAQYITPLQEAQTNTGASNKSMDTIVTFLKGSNELFSRFSTKSI